MIKVKGSTRCWRDSNVMLFTLPKNFSINKLIAGITKVEIKINPIIVRLYSARMPSMEGKKRCRSATK